MKSTGLAAVLCLGAMAMAQDVRFEYDRSANFSTYKTYQWAGDSPNASGNQLMDQNIKQAIDEQLAAADYVKAVVAAYASLPGTPARPSRRDRRLARELYERGLPLQTVRAAFLLAAARRTFRSTEAEPLGAVRTLYYFLPAIEEVAAQPPDPSYIDYLAGKLQSFMKPGGVLLDSG